jgi:glycosyltransferase involved in cell wall biosynthesis
MRLTVAVCTHNPQPDLMRRVLASIAGQLGETPDSELLLVDNNSEPPLQLPGTVDQSSARVVREPRPGLTAAREAAVRAARGEIVLFVDDDNILQPDYVRKVIEEFAADPGLGLLGGSVIPEYETDPPAWLTEFEPQLAIRRYPDELRVTITSEPYSAYFPVGAGFALPRRLGLAYFADAATGTRIEGRRGQTLSAGEDVDLGLFVLDSGHTLRVRGDLRVVHVIPPSRMTKDYIEQLSLGSVASSLEIERKWSARRGGPIFDMFHIPRYSLVAKTIAAGVLRPFSTRYALKYKFFRALAKSRLGPSR